VASVTAELTRPPAARFFNPENQLGTISTANASMAAIPSKGRARPTIPTRRSRHRTPGNCSSGESRRSATTPSRPRPQTRRAYTNPDGIEFGKCHYCGFCERFGCEVDAQRQRPFHGHPDRIEEPEFELRTRAQVLKVNLDGAGSARWA